MKKVLDLIMPWKMLENLSNNECNDSTKWSKVQEWMEWKIKKEFWEDKAIDSKAMWVCLRMNGLVKKSNSTLELFFCLF